MIVLDVNSRNITVAVDNIQAKFVVAMLRTITIAQLIESAKALGNDGFLVSGVEAEAARLSVLSVLGPYLDYMIHPSKLALLPKPVVVDAPEASSAPAEDEESSTKPPKTWLQ